MSRPFHVCVFCGARMGTSPGYARAAAELGRRIGERGLGLVYGGARVGLMGALADAALAAGAPVLGVLPRSLSSVEVAHGGLTDLVLVDGLHARKARMTAESDAFIALPGGFGTLDELFEALTWAQLGLHTRPLGLLNVDGFWDPLVATIDRQVAEGFVTPSDRARLSVETTADALLDALGAGPL
ncbi:MAG TPA: TIGR00730 family Rossman fold protein [Myxococcaceae bacterium]|nr:TIGR00730 family Rossman fold protein [Myxococcaceae bacterium]